MSETAAETIFPLGEARRVAITWNIRFGCARDEPTGVPTECLAACAEGNSLEEVAHWYDVPLEAVKCAVEFETRKRKEPRLRALEEAAQQRAEAYWHECFQARMTKGLDAGG